MNILELLKTVDELAKVIVQKNKELEQLKDGYDSKIRQLNAYVELVQQGIQTQDGSTTISSEKLGELIKQPIVCSKCDNTIWNTSENDDFILIPKHKIELHEAVDSEQPSLHPVLVPVQERKSKSTSNKRICSYCKQPGHSRAKCPARLGLTTDVVRNHHP